MTNKNINELSVNLVEAWLAHDSEVSNEIGRTSVKGQPISVKEVAQAFLDFQHVLLNGTLPERLDKSEEESN